MLICIFIILQKLETVKIGILVKNGPSVPITEQNLAQKGLAQA